MSHQEQSSLGKPPYLSPPPALAENQTTPREGSSHEDASTLPAKKGITVSKLKFPSVLRPKIWMNTPDWSIPPIGSWHRSQIKEQEGGTTTDSHSRSVHPRIRHAATLKPAKLTPIKPVRKSMETHAARAETNATGDQIVAHSGRVTRSQAAKAAEAVREDEPAPDATMEDATESEAPPKRAARGAKRTRAQPPDEPTDTAPVTPKAKRKRKGQTEEKPEQLPTQPGATPTDILSGPLAAERSKAGSRSRRPRAADFYVVPDTPAGDADAASTAIMPGYTSASQAPTSPPMRPQLPWESLGIPDTPVESSDRLVTRTRKKKADHGQSHESDPHDKEMDEDYVPAGPGPLPRIPKLPKGVKKGPRKQRPAALGPNDAKTPIIHPDAADTPSCFPPEPQPRPALLPPPPSALAANHVSEADPGIWNLGTNPAPRHSVHHAPARQGNIYCETCFRDDLARWARTRDSVIQALHLLGGDAALQELRTLFREVEDAERHDNRYVHLPSRPQRRRSKMQFKSPPPSEYMSSSSDDADDEGVESQRGMGRAQITKRKKRTGRGLRGVVAENTIVMSELMHTSATSRFSECSVDITGLVLLHVMAGRPTARLGRDNRNQLKKLLDGVRQDLGVGPKHLDALTTLCKDMLVRWRTAGLAAMNPQTPRGGDGEDERWWWQFDETLQHAHLLLSTASAYTPSFFATTLAKRAADAAHTALEAQEAATAPAQGSGSDGQTTGGLAQLEQALGMTVPSNVFLASIGSKLAQARQSLQSDSGKKRLHDSDDATPTLPAKRRKPNNTTTTNKAEYQPTIPLATRADAIPLPCTYCSESDASRAYTAHHTTASTTKNNPHKPWTNALEWAFHLPPDAATRVRKAEDWFHLLATSRNVEVVEVLGEHQQRQQQRQPGEGGSGGGGGGGGERGRAILKFMMDVAGGRTRVVLVEMRGVFEVISSRSGGYRRSGGARVRFAEWLLPSPVGDSGNAARSVGRWEDWRGGKLVGYRLV